MSDSPQSNPKDVEQGAPSGDEEAQMNDPQDPHSTGLGYEFEVKEQDRWLPIANGMSSLPLFDASLMPPLAMIRGVRLWWRPSPHRRLRSACMAAKPSLTGVASALPIRQSRARAKRPPLQRPCRAIRRPGRRRRRLALPHRPPRRTRLMSTMLTFATLPQSPVL